MGTSTAAGYLPEIVLQRSDSNGKCEPKLWASCDDVSARPDMTSWTRFDAE